MATNTTSGMKQISAYYISLVNEGSDHDFVFQVGCRNSFIRHKNIEEILIYLARQSSDVLKVVWNVDEFAAPIIRKLPKYAITKLAKNGVCTWRDLKIRYIREKLFLVKLRDDSPCIYYNLSRWFPDYDSENEPENAQELADLLLQSLYQMGYKPTKLTSPVAMYEKSIMDGMNLPTAIDHYNTEDWEAALFADRCSNRPWREIYKIGYFPDVIDCDIAGAYGTVTKNLIDTRYISWKKSDRFIKDAYYAYMLVRLEMDSDIHPIIYRNRETQKLSTPNGEFYTYITREEYIHIVKYRLGKVDIIEGWFGIPSKIVYPWANAFQSLFRHKQSQSAIISETAKQIAASVWGKFRELHEREPGKYFNSFWAAQCESLPRLEVHKFILRNHLESRLICTTVDGCIVESGHTNTFDLSGNGFFRWKTDFVGPAIALSSYNNWYGSKKPEGLSIQDVREMIEQDLNNVSYHKTITRRVTMKEALEYGDIDTIGTEKDFSAGFYIVGNDYERYFTSLPMTGKDILTNQYTSVPKVI